MLPVRRHCHFSRKNALSSSLLNLFRYGEIVDVNMPRDKDTGKTRGFGFIMYEDQRSTVLAVDNLNGGKVLDRILRVDHVKNYKQPRVMNDEGEMVDRDEQSLNAMPKLITGDFLSSQFPTQLMLI